jgi:molecular chaperone GrpE
LKTDLDSQKEDEEETKEECEAPAEAAPTIEEIQKKNDELLDTLMRLQAEFDNYKKRAAKDKEEHAQLAGARIIKELLGLLDNFDRALSEKNEGSPARRGLEMMRAQLVEILRREGVTEIATDCKLDPFQHEVMSKVVDPGKEDDDIVECLQKGYKIKGRVIRPARVVVCKKEIMNSDEGNQDDSFKSNNEDNEVN